MFKRFEKFLYRVSVNDVGFYEHKCGLRMHFLHSGLVRLNSATSSYMFSIENVVIDSCSPHMNSRAVDFVSKRMNEQKELKSRGAHFSKFPFLLVAGHHHEDHVGGIEAIRRWSSSSGFEPAVYLPEKTLSLVRNGFKMEPVRRIFLGDFNENHFIKEAMPLPVAFQVCVNPSDPSEIAPKPLNISYEEAIAISPCSENTPPSRITVVTVPVPGHCEDHTVFYIPELKWLYSGDMYLTHFPNISFDGEDLDTMILSLKKVVEDLNPEMIFCSHRGPIKGIYLRKKLERLLQLRSDAKKLRNENPSLSDREICRKILGTEGLLYYTSFGAFSKLRLTKRLLESDDRLY